jgi:hypothetical protein
MTNRLATRIGVPVDDDRAVDALDVVAFTEPAIGALARTKGSLYLLAQVTRGAAGEPAAGDAAPSPSAEPGRRRGPKPADRALRKAAERALADLERAYYYDLSAGVLVSLSRAMRDANRRLFHDRRRLGIPQRAGISITALVVRGREAHVAKLGPAAAVIVRDGRMYELPPPAAPREPDPRLPARRVAASLGEALEIEPFTWQGDIAPGDRLALLSRHLAGIVGVDDLHAALVELPAARTAERLQQLFRERSGRGSDAALVVEIDELPATATTHHLEPVRPAEPLAGLPDQSPVPLADAIGGLGHRIGRGIRSLRSMLGQAVLHLMSWILAFVPRRRPSYPKSVVRTSEVEEGRRRRLGLLGMVGVALVVAAGASVYSIGGPRPTEAIPRLAVARDAIGEATSLVAQVEETDHDGADLVVREPERAKELLNDAFGALDRARGAGVAADGLDPLQARVDRGLDALYRVTRLADIAAVADLGTLDGLEPLRMAAASDGTLWVIETGRGRLLRLDPATGVIEVVARAGQALEGGTFAEPWLIATAATDVVVVDRGRQAWRFDLTERIGRAMPLTGIESISPRSRLLGALQHRPPLEIFTLYLVDGANGAISKWTPPPVIPVSFPSAAEAFLTEAPDLPAQEARDLRVDVNLWLLQRSTVTRVNFGTPLGQGDYSLDPPPDGEVRNALDYRLFDGATVGDRELFYVYDAGNARIVAFNRADGAFVRQWLAPRSGSEAALLGDVLGMSVTSVADGPPSAYLLTSDRLVRVVLE